MLSNEIITIKPIGIVKNGIKQPPGEEWWLETISEIVINTDLTEAVEDLEGFSHIIVLYWMNQLKTSETPNKVHPKGRPDRPLVGVLATRSPNRPNPIGKATVRLLGRQDNVLKVQGLDALDGTPVIDIKPYLPWNDSAANATMPPWITKH